MSAAGRCAGARGTPSGGTGRSYRGPCRRRGHPGTGSGPETGRARTRRVDRYLQSAAWDVASCGGVAAPRSAATFVPRATGSWRAMHELSTRRRGPQSARRHTASRHVTPPRGRPSQRHGASRGSPGYSTSRDTVRRGSARWAVPGTEHAQPFADDPADAELPCALEVERNARGRRRGARGRAFPRVGASPLPRAGDLRRSPAAAARARRRVLHGDVYAARGPAPATGSASTPTIATIRTRPPATSREGRTGPLK